MYKNVSRTVVRLNKPKTLGGVEPFNCAVLMTNPFHGNIRSPSYGRTATFVSILMGKFVKGAPECADSKVRSNNIDEFL
jgi:hypothetical protein